MRLVSPARSGLLRSVRPVAAALVAGAAVAASAAVGLRLAPPAAPPPAPEAEAAHPAARAATPAAPRAAAAPAPEAAPAETVPMAAAPSLTATLVAALADPLDPEVNPGDVLRYTLTIANGGPDAATGLAVDLLGDAAFVPGSLEVSPLAFADAYPGAFAGLAFTVPAATGVLAGDSLGLPAAGVASFGGGTVGGTAATHPAGTTAAFGAGGQLRVDADGSVALTAPTGFSGALTFRYRAANAAGADEAQVSVTVAVPVAPTAVADGPAAGSAPGAAFHGAFNTPFALAAPGVLANDTRGTPTASLVSFGGGSLPGTAATNAAGATVVAAQGTLSVGADGAVAFAPAAGFTGLVSFQYRLANAAGTSDATATIAVGVRPAAVADTYAPRLVGNVPVSTTAFSVSANDAGDARTLAVTAQTNGTAALGADGRFTFTPALGYAGPASFAYTVSNGFGTTAAATVSFTVDDIALWAVDAAAPAGGDGRLATPFNCLVGPTCFSASTLDGANDRIYLASGAYTGGLTLLGGQRLIGEGATADFLQIAGFTSLPLIWPLDSGFPPETGGAAPTISGGTGNGITLGSGNTVWGLALGNAPGVALAGTSFGTLTVSDASISTTGAALDLTTGTISGSLAGLTSSGGAYNVRLTNVATVGSVTLGSAAGALSGATTAAVEISGESGQVVFPGTLANTAGTAVRVLGKTGGAVTFGGAINAGLANGRGILVSGNSGGTAVTFSGSTQRVRSGGNVGVDLNNNTGGSAVRFTGGALDVETTTGDAFRALLSGSVAVTGASNRLVSAGGEALVIAGATIAADGLRFRSISATGGPQGIRLQGAGTAGRLVVTGDGSTLASGGTIRNTTNAGVLVTSGAGPSLAWMTIGEATAAVGEAKSTAVAVGTSGADGIQMSNVAGTVLTGLRISRTGRHGISGTGVNGLAMTNVHVLNAGDGVGESGLFFAASGAANLTGVAALTNVVVDGAAAHGLRVRNESGALNLTVTGGQFTNTRNVPGGGALDNVGEDGVQIAAFGTASITALVSGATFANTESDGLQGVAGGTGGAVLNLTASNNTFAGYRDGPALATAGNRRSDNAVELNATGTTVLRYTLSGNTMTASENQAILLGGNDAAQVQGRVVNNTVDGSTTGFGIEANPIADETANSRLLVQGNTIRNTRLEAMIFSSNLQGTLNLRLIDNVVPTAPGNTADTFENVQAYINGTSQSCFAITGNQVAAGGSGTGGIYLSRPNVPPNTSVARLERGVYVGANPDEALLANNPSAPSPFTEGITLVPTGTCLAPDPTPTPTGAPPTLTLADAPAPEALPAPTVPALDEVAVEEVAEALPAEAPAPAAAAPAEAAPAEAAPAAAGTDGAERRAALEARTEALRQTPQQSVAVGTLAAGKQVVVRYRAAVASPFPFGAAVEARAAVTAANAAAFAAETATPVVQSATRARAFAGVPAEGPDAGWRLLAAPVGGLTVAALASQNLVQGIPGEYPAFGANLLTGYDGAAFAAPAGTGAALAPGRGFFWYLYDQTIVPDGGGTSQSRPLPFTLTATGAVPVGSAVLPLHAAGDGANLVGNPWPEPLDVSGVAAWATGGALASAVVQTWTLAGGAGSYEIVTELPVWQGAWVENATATALAVPPAAMVGGGLPNATAVVPTLALELAGTDAATGGPTLDRAARVVFREDALDAWDLNDATKLTPMAAAYATVAPQATGRTGAPALRAQDSRPLDADVTELPLVVDAVGTAPALTLRWPDLSSLPAAWRLTLRDLETGTETDLRAQPSLTFSVAARASRVALAVPGAVAGTPRFVLRVERSPVSSAPSAAPTAFALHAPSPNPVAADGAAVRYDLPDAVGHVRVTVVDLLGREVAVLADGPAAAGSYAARWNPGRVSAGVYLVRMQAGAFAQTRRVTVVR